ncbi:4a-hydroxytetrahydrobiopterin dehydratase [Gammaproteobacteria bacterium]|nr:4a-hydroxytetrahydrobiopterin dehydratase [Gammaproteobacteria bacterium]
MSDLASNTCEACRIDAPKVSDDEVNILLKEIDNWDLIHEEVKQLKKTFSFSSYKESVDFSNKVAKMADIEDHHPTITLEWGKVTVVWWSHKIKGLHKNDFICAAKTDQLNNY